MREHPVSARGHARVRVIFTGVVAVAIGLLLPAVFVGMTAQAANPLTSVHDDCVAAIGASRSVTSLCVESSADGSRTAPYAGTIQKGDRIDTFKWLVNDDSTGQTDMSDVNVAVCLPDRARPNPLAPAGSPEAIYNNSGRGLHQAVAGTPKSPWWTNPAGTFVVDTSGTPDIPYGPENCPWPSVRSSEGHSNVVANGTQDDLQNLANLPDGKYLVSVTAANFKIDGVHFVVAGGTVVSVNDEPNTPFIVRMNPLPKKTATVRVHVYNDNASTNGQWDGQTETLVTCADATPAQRTANCGGSSDPNLVGDPSTDMSGFSVQITDVLNPVTTDVFGNPLCTVYETDEHGNVILNSDGSPNPIVFGDSITTIDPVTGLPADHGTSSAIPSEGGQSGSTLAGTQSGCISDHYGDIVIPNMGPNRYAATVIPPDPRTHNGAQWVQTTTLEGGHDWDTWNIEGGTGYDTELIVGGERVPPVAHGFVKLTHSDGQTTDYAAHHTKAQVEAWYYDASKGFDDPNVVVNKNGELTGKLMIGRAYIGSGPNGTGTVVPLTGTNLANAKADGPIEDGLISINCIATCSAPTDSAVWVGRAHKDGTFDVKGLETGDYSVAFWDEAQSYILVTLQYHVTSTPPQVAVDSATVLGNNRTLNFAANAGFAVGDHLTTTSGDNGWTGTFQVLSVSANGRAVRVAKTSGPQPTATATTTVALAPFISSATLAPDPLSTATVKPNVPTVVFGRTPGVPLGSTIFLDSGSGNAWTGNFLVKWVSADGLTVTLDKVTGGNPTGAASPLPAMNITPTGDILLAGWFTDIQGSVFNDLNGNGVRDKCTQSAATCAHLGYAKNEEGVWTEPGIPDFVLTERTRGNSLQDQGAALATTNDQGTFDLSQGYPLGQFLIFEAYNQRYKNTGITYTTDNDPTPHTIHSAQVDYNFLPVIGLSAKIDVGVQAYGTGTDYWSGDTSKPAPKDENGAIVGTVGYDVTRNEFDPAYSVQEDYQPGISGISMQLWKTHKSDGVHPDTWSGPGESGAVKQYGITAAGASCLRPDASRGTNAVKTVQSCLPYDYYVTESWTRPTGCQALDVSGQPLVNEQALPAAETPIDYSHSDPTHHDCVEAPMSGIQIGGDGTVDGNFALTSLIHGSTLGTAIAAHKDLEQVYADAQNNPAEADPLPAGDYVVEAVNPVDTVNARTTSDPTNGGFAGTNGASTPKGLYRYTDEGVVNVMTGDTYVPQEGFTGENGATVDGTYHLHLNTHKNIRADVNSLGAGTVAKCAGTIHTVTNENPDFAAAGGSPYLGEKTPICDAKVVKVVGGRSVNPGFFMYTDVPIPSKFYGLINDDLNVNTDRRSIMLGEVAPVSNGPVGIYDENGNWKYTAHSDVNGFYEVILPSMDTYSCPLPAGPCPNMYRLVGNDPGTLGHRNTDYNPQFRTIATEFQAWAGVVHPVDQAPTHQGITIEGPAAQFGALSLCKLADNNPSFFAIDKPYFDAVDNDSSKTYTVDGAGFGSAPLFTFSYTNADGTIDPNKVYVVNPTASASAAHPLGWDFTIPSAMQSNPGPYQLTITNTDPTSGLKSVNGITFHVLGSGYLGHDDIYVVSPDATTDAGHTFTPQMDAWDPLTDTPAGFSGTSKSGDPVSGGRAIQRAVEAAYAHSNGGKQAKLVVIYPNTAPNYAPHNAFAAYFENVVLHGRVKLQGVGPGSTNVSNTDVDGTNIDASQFWSATQMVPPGGNQDTSDGSYSDDWRTFAAALPRAGAGPAEMPEGEGVLAIAETTTQYADLRRNGHDDLSRNLPLFHSGVDGILLTGGNQQGNPGNVNTAPGAVGNGTIAPTPPGPAQGGAIMLDQYVRDFSITNDLIQSNGGSYGTVRIGTPDLGTTSSQQDNHNERLTVANNRFVANGGTNLAGALGIFYGADKYTVKDNDFCGNFSAEYGGAISHYGASPGGQILHNRIYYNQGYDEGGGIIIAGNLPANNSTLSDGAGGYYYLGNTRTLGGVTIDGNTLISNQSNDDGGGLRFLMAGDWPSGSTYPTDGVPFTVTNNIIANNLSTHEGGGVAIDDTPNITLVNNTIVKNITTGTAATNGAILGGTIQPQNPAGLSTGANSSLLQAKLPAGSELFSDPMMFNNIFEDNRAGWAALPTTANTSTSLIHGIGGPGDTTEVWDMGVVGMLGASLKPVNSVLSPPSVLTYPVSAGGVTPSSTNVVTGIANVKFVNPQDFQVDSLMWRPNTNVSYPVIVAQMVPVNLLADYHLQDATSAAAGVGTAVATFSGPPAVTVAAPRLDIDGQPRPLLGPVDAGADEVNLLQPLALPTLPVLDNFNRANSGTLGGNWTQSSGTFQVSSNRARASSSGLAFWSNTSFGTASLGQAAAFTVVSGPVDAALQLRTTLVLTTPLASTRVQYTTVNGVGVVRVQSIVLGVPTTVGAGVATLKAGNTLSARSNVDGTVDVWITSGGVVTYLGRSTPAGTATGSLVGMQLNSGTVVDNFAGGTTP